MTIIAACRDRQTQEIVLLADSLGGVERRWPHSRQKLLLIAGFAVGIAGHGYDVSKHELLAPGAFELKECLTIDTFTRKLREKILALSTHVPNVCALITDGNRLTSIDWVKGEDGIPRLVIAYNDIRHSRGDLGWLEMNLFETTASSSLDPYSDTEMMYDRIRALHKAAGYPDVEPQMLQAAR